MILGLPFDDNIMTPAIATPPSNAETPVDGYFPFIEPPEGPSPKETATVSISPARKYALLITFCLAQFMDSFNNSALYSAMPSFIIDLGITEGQSTWVMSIRKTVLCQLRPIGSTASIGISWRQLVTIVLQLSTIPLVRVLWIKQIMLIVITLN